MALLTIFRKFLRDYEDEEDRWEILAAMMEMRAEFSFHHAVRGFGMDFKDALELVRSADVELSPLEQNQRTILLAALDNLVDFAVAAEYQMSEALPEEPDEVDTETEEWEDYETECIGVCQRYNYNYAMVENGDIEYAMGIAAFWAKLENDEYLTYMTQGDDRVRPWHAALEGLRFRQSQFPSWLIPPIEHNCRCFLVEDSSDAASEIGDVYMKKMVEMPDFINPVFKESVAKGERIFSEAHSYFSVKKKDKKRLRAIAKTIKDKWLK